MGFRSQNSLSKPTMKSYALFLLMVSFKSTLSLVRFPSETSSSATNRRTVLRDGWCAIASSACLIGSPGTCGIIIHPVNAASSTVGGGFDISSRLNTDILTMPPIERGRAEIPSLFGGSTVPPNLHFPPWMEGEWDVTQTLVRTAAPMGRKFLGGPSGDERIAEQTLMEQNKKVGIPVNLHLRWVATKFGVLEDRMFNTKSRLDSFAGRIVVASVEYADTGDSNRSSILSMGGSKDDPLLTTVVYFKGPAAQKTFSLARGGEEIGGASSTTSSSPSAVTESNDSSSNTWIGYELFRSIFALTNNSARPPVTTDTETIWSLERISDGLVKGRLRIANYLSPQSDVLYFDAKNRAVAISDYSLELRRIGA